jgi:4-hydroxy-tetrahydrodipicolinate reductase
VIDYADASKPDAPSGTARELAERLAAAGGSSTEVTDAADSVTTAARGTLVGSVRVHSVRLPSFSVSTEVVFGLPDERLTIRHDAGMSAAPYVAGTLLAIRSVVGRVGLTRGLDTLLAE